MRTVINWDEWVANVRQDVDPLEDHGEPYRVDADGDPFDPDLFVEVLSELESRGVDPEGLVALTDAEQIAGLLVRVNYLDRRPAAVSGPGLPEDMTLYGVPVRSGYGFPSRTLVLFPPTTVAFDGTARAPSFLAVVENLQVPDLDDAPIVPEGVRRDLFEACYPGGSGGGPGEDAPDSGDEGEPERRGTRFVEDPDDEDEEESEA